MNERRTEDELSRMANDLRVLIEAEEEPAHPDDDELMSLVDGELRGETLERVRAHVAECRSCAEDFAVLEATRAKLRRPRPLRSRRWRVAAIAASIAAVALLVLLLASRRPGGVEPAPPVVARTAPALPEPASYGRGDWDDAVRNALSTGRLEMPAVVVALRPPAARPRGADPADEQSLQPDGVVVDDVHPRFTWNSRPGARYVVVLALDDDVVAESDALDDAQWQPDFDLERGREYSWQVEITQNGRRTVHPAAPQPPARFRVVDESASAELREARARFPDDRLLHAVLLARHGLVAEAERALVEYSRSGRAPAADALLRSIRSWATR